MTYVNHPVENIDRKETLNNPPQSSPAFGGSSLSRFQFKHLILYTRPADSPLLTSWALPSLGHHSGSSLRSASQHLPPHLSPPHPGGLPGVGAPARAVVLSTALGLIRPTGNSSKPHSPSPVTESVLDGHGLDTEHRRRPQTQPPLGQKAPKLLLR